MSHGPASCGMCWLDSNGLTYDRNCPEHGHHARQRGANAMSSERELPDERKLPTVGNTAGAADDDARALAALGSAVNFAVLQTAEAERNGMTVVYLPINDVRLLCVAAGGYHRDQERLHGQGEEVRRG